MSDSASFALWLIPLLVLVILGVLFVLSRYWQGKAEQVLKGLRAELRQVQSERRGVVAKAQSYSGRDPEPYRSASSGLREKLAAIRREIEDIERRNIELNERASNLKFNRWRTMFGAPYLWQFLRRDASQLHIDLYNVQDDLRQAAQMEASLEHLPWEVAQKARELRSHAQVVNRRLGELGSSGLYGDIFESAAQSERQLQTGLAQIPPIFLEGSEVELLQQSTRSDVALVHQVLEANRPRLDELAELSEKWQADYRTTTEQVAAMTKALDELRQTLANLPAELVVKEELAALRRFDEIAKNLEQAASRLEVESMPLVAEEANGLRQTAQESSQQIKRARRELASFEALLSEVFEGFRELSLQLAALGSRSLHPVEWEVSLEQLAQLNRQANAMGNARQKRKPPQVSEDFKALAGLSAHQKELARYIQEIQTAHAGLVTLLESPEFRSMPKWLESARLLADEAGEYAPENWSGLDNLPGMAAEIAALAAEAERLVGGDPAEPISELRLSERLDQTRLMGEKYRELAARVENVRLRLENLEQSEAQAQEDLEMLQKSLNQIRLIASSNQFLAGAALQEIERMQHTAAELEESLDQTQRGSVDKKSRQVSAMSERAEASAGRWLEQLNKEIQTLHKELAQSLAELEGIARLEDGAIAEARRLLEYGQAGEGEKPPGRQRLDLEASILEIKQCSNHWQECIAAQHALENLQPLVETYREAAFQRERARALVAEAGNTLQKRTWPPVSTSLEPEKQELDRIEADWQALKERSGKAIALVAQYSSLSSRFESLGERLRQSSIRREQEQRQAEDLEEQIAALAEPWEALLSEHKDNPVASREIRGLLGDLDEEMDSLQRSYLRGEMDYNEVMQQMRGLQRRVRYYQVALDDEHALDASGRVTRRRQSERDEF